MIDGNIFVDAYFIDEERKTLETVWFNPDNKEYNSQIIIAEEGDSEWEKFLKTPIDDAGRCVTLEDLYERTYIRLKEIEETHKKIIIDSVLSEDKFLSEAKQDFNKQSMTKLLEVIFTLDGREDSTEEENRERLFLLKLATFEWDKLKDTDKDFKKNIRKAKDVYEVLSIIINHLKK
tara:strand:- start:230 stop:760 length:531 start_codon:yes stop_codon:yes gene_type:complete